MYFYPSKGVADSIIEAIDQGVTVNIITESSVSGPASISEALDIKAKVNPEKAGNLKIWLFQQGEVRFHKKIMIFDDIVFSGSGNMSYKSMILNSDFEINFLVRFEKFSKDLIEVLRTDVNSSSEVTKNSNGFIDGIKSFMWKLGVRFWG